MVHLLAAHKLALSIPLVALSSVAVYADTSFDNVVTTGQVIIAIALGVGTLISIFYGVKFKVSSEAWEKVALAREEAIKDARGREEGLQEALATSKEANAQMRESITRYESMPNLTQILEQMAAVDESRRAQFEMLDRHAAERTEGGVSALAAVMAAEAARAEERHAQVIASGEEIVKALGSIAEKLNGD